jgi:hypothetical protein
MNDSTLAERKISACLCVCVSYDKFVFCKLCNVRASSGHLLGWTLMTYVSYYCNLLRRVFGVLRVGCAIYRLITS